MRQYDKNIIALTHYRINALFLNHNLLSQYLLTYQKFRKVPDKSIVNSPPCVLPIRSVATS